MKLLVEVLWRQHLPGLSNFFSRASLLLGTWLMGDLSLPGSDILNDFFSRKIIHSFRGKMLVHISTF